MVELGEKRMKKLLLFVLSIFMMVEMQLQPVMAVNEEEPQATEVASEEQTEENQGEEPTIDEETTEVIDAEEQQSSESETPEEKVEEQTTEVQETITTLEEASEENEDSDVAIISEEEEQGSTGGDGEEQTQSYTEIQMHRLYNPYSGEHFYTGSYEEFDYLWNLGWEDEGIGWVAPSYSEYPVYRLYNRNAGEHFFTLSESERDNLVKKGWNYEGIGWYSAGVDWQGAAPLYREYNPNAFANNHNYTIGLNEHNYLVSIGWKNEGISWYAVNNYSAAGTREHPKPATPTYYSQRDPRWSGAVYNGYSLYSTGCVPTSVAMVVDGFLHNGVTPNVAADYLVTTGEFAGRKHGGSGLAIKYGAEHWGLKTTGINNYNTLVDCLNAGNIVIFQVGAGTFTSRGSTHAIVLFRNSDGNTCVYDPWNAHNGWYSIAMIWNQRSTSSYDWTGGYVGYGIYQ